MSTRRSIVSDIRSFNKLLSSDQIITDRVIDREAFSTALVFIKQQTNKRLLFQSSTLFTSISCLKMKPVPIGECCDYASPYMISRSVEKIPKIAEGIFGLLVQNCVSIDNLNSFRESTPRRFANALKLGLKTEINVFWIFNGYLYCSNGKLEAVNFSALFEEDVPNSLLCPDCECEPNKECDECINPLDLPFKCPGYLEKPVKDEVAKKLISTFFNLPSDKTSNNLDETSK